MLLDQHIHPHYSHSLSSYSQSNIILLSKAFGLELDWEVIIIKILWQVDHIILLHLPHIIGD